MGRASLAFLGLLATFFCTTEGHTEGALFVGRANNQVWWGTSRNHQTHDEARLAALQQCARGGPNCAFIAKVSGSCLAVAFSVRGNGFSWATRGTPQDAAVL